jgi:hypothetical protein
MARRPCRQGYADQLRQQIHELCPSSLFDGLTMHGNAEWTPLRLVMTLALMSWHDAQTLTSRFQNVRDLLARMFPDWVCPTSYTGYAEALARWIEPLFQRVRRQLQQRLRAMAHRRWRLFGWVVFAADGSRFESPRTQANESVLKCAGKTRTAPQVFHTMLLHLGINALWDFRTGPGTDSERRHLEAMAGELPPRSLIVADGGFLGYELCRRLQSAGVSFLLRVGGNITLLTEQMGTEIQQEGDRVWLWPQLHRGDSPLELRLILLGRGRSAVFLVTDVLDPSGLSAAQAAELYRRRWGIEVSYRTIKQTLDRGVWLSRTPRTVLAEHTATLLGVWMLQVLSLESLARHRRNPREWSPSRSRDVTRRVMRLAFDREFTSLQTWSDELSIAVRDRYVRRRSKVARRWPFKKQIERIRPPHFDSPTARQRVRGQRLIDGS